MHEYERKLDEFVKSPEILEELSIKVYNRKLMQLLREIIRDFNTVPCPLSEQELKRIGIDRTTMPQPANVSHKSKYQGGRGDMFNPAWQPNAQPMNVRRPYNARGSKNNDGQNKNNDRKTTL
uniref:Uncharacterized protein n=1 Tax=Panagrolaimus superbus TaxID=310955 RepID=A0A914ZAL1_9BILA